MLVGARACLGVDTARVLRDVDKGLLQGMWMCTVDVLYMPASSWVVLPAELLRRRHVGVLCAPTADAIP